MKQDNPVSLDEFQEALTPQNIRVMQMIYVALGLGIFSFFAVVVFLQFQQPAGEEVSADLSLLKMLSLIHLVMALVCFGASKVVHDMIIKSSSRLAPSSTADSCFGIIRTASIVRLALMEGAAFFGLVVCLMGAVEGQLEENPLYWLNALSCLAMIAFIIMYFPSKAGLEQIFQNKFLNRT